MRLVAETEISALVANGDKDGIYEEEKNQGGCHGIVNLRRLGYPKTV